MTDTLAPSRPAGGPTVPGGPRLPEIPGPLDAAMLAWRTLRRMSTALVLLFAMAAASVVATFVPQEPLIPTTVGQWRDGTAGPGSAVSAAFDALGFFDVFGSWWFAALTVLLFVSLTGCLIPRYRSFRGVVRRPPAAGRRLDRLSSRRVLATSLPPDEALAAAERVLGERRFRRRRLSAEESPAVDPATGQALPQVAAERGHWREGGSLIFHTAFYLLLVGILVGQGFGFTGQINLVEGEGFADARLSYDAAAPGRLWGVGDHRGFNLTLEDFEVSYHPSQAPADFVSTITLRGADGDVRSEQVRVNHPVRFEGMNIYQQRFGMAPHLVVRDATTGRTIFEQSVPLTDAGGNTWSGATKVHMGGEFTDQATGQRREIPQLALDMAFLPDATVIEGPNGPLRGSASPDPDNPRVLADLYVGELGLEQPQPVSELRAQWEPRQLADRMVLTEGEAVEVAGGTITVEFSRLDMWSGFQVSHQPGRWILLLAAGSILVGLLPSLYAYRRRVWVTARANDQGSEVVLAGAALQRAPTFTEEFEGVAAELRKALPGPSEQPPTSTER
ncbi:MAG: hypothetical protein GEU81_00835 [Nitriliruptorales bacterium]|nr:hypothetical protein [Nitriliruptorales bacterium]